MMDDFMVFVILVILAGFEMNVAEKVMENQRTILEEGVYCRVEEQ